VLKSPISIENRSPSPAVTITGISGLDKRAPTATGTALPWIVCIPKVFRYSGKREEQPMPEITFTLDDSICFSENICVRAARIL
jgi:hypothetical protein